ncbi:MAG TPA: hypothetical protein VL181_07080 [Holophagaceae bacterium]|nr:hypothetical protein [Holophagaceae bacterium]
MRKSPLLLSLVLLGSALACGGGAGGSQASATAPATRLSYSDPSGTGWRLVKDGSSTPARLVLDLVGPAGLKTRGAGFNLVAPKGIRFGTFPSADPVPDVGVTDFPIRDTGVYELKNTDNLGDPLEPVLLSGGVKPGNLLTVGIFQKDRRATAKDSGVPLCQIALELDPAAHLDAGVPLPLSVVKAKYIAEDIGAFSITPTAEMVTKAKPVDFTLAVGQLRCN